MMQKDLPVSTIVLLSLLLGTLLGTYLLYRNVERKYIHVEEVHIYDVKTPYGDLHKETRSEKRFDPGEDMAQFYLQNPPKN